jgi:hypothetical protein
MKLKVFGRRLTLVSLPDGAYNSPAGRVGAGSYPLVHAVFPAASFIKSG